MVIGVVFIVNKKLCVWQFREKQEVKFVKDLFSDYLINKITYIIKRLIKKH